MKPLIKLKHESGYYWGLGLMLASCLSLFWALWRDAFTPQVFLAGLLAFSWGYILLWRHDINARFAALEAEAATLKARLDLQCEEAAPPVWTQELPEAEEPPDERATLDTATETPNETRAEVETPEGPSES